MIKLKGWAAVVRDTIMFIVIAIIGFLAVPVVFGPEPSRYVIDAWSIFVGTIAFCISACMIKDNRWKHINKVAIAICIINAVNVAITMLVPFRDDLKLTGLIIFNILIGVAGVYIMMALGGGLSFVFVKIDGKDQKNIKNN
ncbi:MAG: hypothetical protein KKC46_04280 [Proteobacteria bacterium]|nr:hypothetical protein [Pseudomonadota bacterium]